MSPQKMMICLVFLFYSAFSFSDSPIGLWTTIDDDTGKPKSVVEITETNGTLTGKIIALLNPKEENPSCKKCKGDNANQPILGLTIIWDTQQKGSAWKGKILDPNNGKTYKVKLTPTEEGKKLKVRGYIGSPILGRTQVWLRKEKK